MKINLMVMKKTFIGMKINFYIKEKSFSYKGK